MAMKEIARKVFMTLNEDRGTYYILNDQNFVTKFPARNDEEAKRKFRKWCDDREKKRRTDERKAKRSPHEEWVKQSVEECFNGKEFDWDEYQYLCDIGDNWFE